MFPVQCATFIGYDSIPMNLSAVKLRNEHSTILVHSNLEVDWTWGQSEVFL